MRWFTITMQPQDVCSPRWCRILRFSHRPSVGAEIAKSDVRHAMKNAHMSRIGFLHTSPVHVLTFDNLLSELAPEAHPVHVVDESLLTDARANGPQSVADRVEAHLRSLKDRGVELICCTCSTLGSVAEQSEPGVPVFRVDRPMAARAFQAGRRIAVIAALDSTLAPTLALLEEEASAADHEVETTPIVAKGAWDMFEAGDQAGYVECVARTARAAAPTADVVILAQASMAPAEALLTDLPTPVFSSPRPAVEYLAARQ